MLAFFDEDHADAFREVVNIGMGAAANSLARTLNTFVRLPVPSIRLLQASDILSAIVTVTGADAKLTAVRQAFSSHYRGEALVLFGEGSVADLAPYLGYDKEVTTTDAEEILLEISNILVGACVGGIAQQMSDQLVFSAPSFIGHDRKIDELIQLDQITWARSLLVEVNFRLEEKNFICHVLLLWPEASIELITRAIDRLIEGT